MRTDDTPAAEHHGLDVDRARHDLELLRERSAEVYQTTLVLRERARSSCERSRLAREAVILARIEWHVWREAKGAARQVAGAVERCVLVVCDECEAVSFMSRVRRAALADVDELVPISNTWVVPPPAVRASLRATPTGPNVQHLRCPSCAARRPESTSGDSDQVVDAGLATELLAVLAQITDSAETLQGEASRLGEHEALAQAFDTAIERLEDTVSADEMAEFAKALSALLRALHGAAPVESAREARTRPAARIGRFRPRLRAR